MLHEYNRIWNALLKAIETSDDEEVKAMRGEIEWYMESLNDYIYDYALLFDAQESYQCGCKELAINYVDKLLERVYGSTDEVKKFILLQGEMLVAQIQEESNNYMTADEFYTRAMKLSYDISELLEEYCTEATESIIRVLKKERYSKQLIEEER